MRVLSVEREEPLVAAAEFGDRLSHRPVSSDCHTDLIRFPCLPIGEILMDPVLRIRLTIILGALLVGLAALIVGFYDVLPG